MAAAHCDSTARTGTTPRAARSALLSRSRRGSRTCSPSSTTRVATGQSVAHRPCPGAAQRGAQAAVHRVLNMWNYDLTRKCLIAEAWCPVSKYDEMCQAVRRGGLRAGAAGASIVNVIDTEEKPPTYFQQNKFTAGFQGIVDGYGVPRCGEINPAAFTIITYPFLFGVMFGDVGHGLIVLCASLYFIRNERKFSAKRPHEIGEILGFPWHGRYVLL